MKWILSCLLIAFTISTSQSQDFGPATETRKDRQLAIMGTYGIPVTGVAVEFYISPALEGSFRLGSYLLAEFNVLGTGGINYHFIPKSRSRWSLYTGLHFTTFEHGPLFIFFQTGFDEFKDGRASLLFQPVGVEYFASKGFVFSAEMGPTYLFGSLEKFGAFANIKLGHRFKLRKK